ncbi:MULTISPECIES: SgcJ/EcaC family oxidoreductase [Actinomadura]|uniref:SgcJ/EcaC family oxidoreductase n=1 Tax=Actinomadura litoris TaxID=2678616 RepID=A0A7K1L266_9ACTN|nr:MULTISPECIES: SgcJ/EcaC family oxidoreductase [Actinomadura]MBT2206507.1 SgcJ/EcaC family oxidoreductase [Actinomadura sp. NEAU-AAG7]MUN38393.1 SgcJ/EcaC family oxidoreductase [Actinomadura litoris]
MSIDLMEVQQVPNRIVAAWAKNDAGAFAKVFAEDGTLVLPGGVFLKGREEIRAHMAGLYEGELKGTTVTGSPQLIKPLSDSIVLLINKGGVLHPGDTEPSEKEAIRATWLLVKQNGEWLISAYQNTPLAS